MTVSSDPQILLVKWHMDITWASIDFNISLWVTVWQTQFCNVLQYHFWHYCEKQDFISCSWDIFEDRLACLTSTLFLEKGQWPEAQQTKVHSQRKRLHLLRIWLPIHRSTLGNHLYRLNVHHSDIMHFLRGLQWLTWCSRQKKQTFLTTSVFKQLWHFNNTRSEITFCSEKSHKNFK